MLIGPCVVTLPGVHIDHRAIIGAVAVVTGDIESHSIAAEVPARIMRGLKWRLRCVSVALIERLSTMPTLAKKIQGSPAVLRLAYRLMAPGQSGAIAAILQTEVTSLPARTLLEVGCGPGTSTSWPKST